jgi:lipid II:glycine glycyltransferase (peptidoglycan interpeptide bridge formation enzyme)
VKGPFAFRPVTDADRDDWQTFLEQHASGDFLHDWAWAPVAELDGQPQRRFVLSEDSQPVAIVAAQVRQLTRGRSFWYVPHGPVLDYGADGASRRVAATLDGLRAAGREEGAIAVKIEPRIEAGAPALAALSGHRLRRTPGTLQVAQTRIVELAADDDKMLAGFDKDTRYSVRRAQREGVTVRVINQAEDLRPIDALHRLVEATQQRAGFAMPPLARYRAAWSALAGAGRARILEARVGDELVASGMLVVEGDRSFYLFSGSRREAAGEQKRYASYALQWAMMRDARDSGVRYHDLWGIAPHDAGPDHPWHGVGLFKKGFGGREVIWAGSWDLVIDPNLYRLREATSMMRRAVARLRLGRANG